MLHSAAKSPTRVAIKRIIPISSGKGGVGKTTFAINFSLALSRHGRTVLVDLDTGTSAIRNAIDVPIEKDLYHFFRKGESLNDCVTISTTSSIRKGSFRNFGFVAGPLHLIDEITNFGAAHKARLIEAINGLDADYVILDMRAGLDSNVIDFLPFSNSGVLDLHAASAQRHARRLGHRQGDPLPQAAADLQPGVAVLRDGAMANSTSGG